MQNTQSVLVTVRFMIFPLVLRTTSSIGISLSAASIPFSTITGRPEQDRFIMNHFPAIIASISALTSPIGLISKFSTRNLTTFGDRNAGSELTGSHLKY